nr:MAG TPA: hypothetical protein [Caudoviricetes sp.]
MFLVFIYIIYNYIELIFRRERHKEPPLAVGRNISMCEVNIT